VPEGTIDLEHFYLETHVLEPLENPFGTKVLPMFPGWTNAGWCAQGDDLRNFSGRVCVKFATIWSFPGIGTLL
jgi:hypothetical protein